jgi:hypothetical protein
MASATPAEQHFAHDGAALQQAHGKVHAAHGICRAVVDAHAIGSQRLGLGAGAVPDMDLMAGLGQAAGHGQAHHARAQNGDLQCVHGVVSLELLMNDDMLSPDEGRNRGHDHRSVVRAGCRKRNARNNKGSLSCP